MPFQALPPHMQAVDSQAARRRCDTTTATRLVQPKPWPVPGPLGKERHPLPETLAFAFMGDLNHEKRIQDQQSCG